MSQNASLSAAQFKAKTHDAWNNAAKGWNEHSPQIHQWLTAATQLMFDLADIKPAFNVLDVAAGSGDQTIDAARRVGASGSVLATDISERILELARENAHKAGLNNIEIKVADAENLDPPAAHFDAAICRLGLMFCPNPAAALQQMHHALKSDSRACVMVFSQPEKNPCVGILLQTAFKHAGLPPPNPYQPGALFSLGKPGYLDELFASAGFENVSSKVVQAPFNLPTAASYLEFIRNSASPIMQILGTLNESDRAAAWDEMEQKLQVFQTENGWQGPNELLLTAGSK